MEYGDRGKKVKIAQKCLKKAGSNISVTGVYSIGMVSAVSKYQKAHNLNRTGKIDKRTWAILKKELPFWKRLF